MLKTLSKDQHIQYKRIHLHEKCALLRYYEPSSGNFFRHFGTTYRSHFQRLRIRKESRLYKYTVFIRKSAGGDKFSATWCQAVWLMQVVGRLEECVYAGLKGRFPCEKEF